ncbi:SusD/RagB family nutrient-binding outer membrane lipoprotein [Spirosoma spitsbergense]|uniref:SusD/RagB family nutrient-binding outer membrane lipoprotein n=1 Tax=Spirosoma spitsbergense TaxID=431554 RepID=UPI00035D19E1|nr:SusD/RagB family nutrient-binding outer membrane lipoprotein [Spirosoma spitsbergense]
MKHTFFKSLLFGGCVALVSACSITELDINQDPNKPSAAALKLLLPTAELAATNSMVQVVSDAGGFAGLRNSADNYNLTNNSYNGTWNSFYRSMQNVEEILKATDDGKSPIYRGIAMVLKAYAVGNMVDQFGDIPYSEAWKGNIPGTDKAVKFDKDVAIYENIIKLCDQAVVELAKPQAVAVASDFIGAGSAATWTRLAKTVKLRLLFNSRKGRATGNADLKAAFDAGGFITTPAQNFVYQYSTQISPQDDRHPLFQGPYTGTGDATYINHQLMGEMILNMDPRLPFYFYRQTSATLDPSNPTDRGTIPFGGTYLPLRPAFLAEYKRVFYNDTQDPTKADIAYLSGFFGRDRGDNTGAPADGALRATPGAYPAGGFYSGRETPAKTLTGNNPGGNGIWPLITSWNIKFYQVEAILDGTGVTGDAKALFEAAMREQIALVVSVSQKADSRSVAPTDKAITDYVNAWLKLYDAALSDQAKLNVVAKQVWFSSYGQGQEIWNMMRRTGYPVQGPFKQFSVGIQPPILKPPRQYALRLPYPAQEGNLNPNAATYVANVIFDRDPVFWDKTKYKWEF